MRQVPTQSVTVVPDRDVIDHAEEMYAQTDPDKGRKEFIREWVIDSVQLEVDLEAV